MRLSTCSQIRCTTIFLSMMISMILAGCGGGGGSENLVCRAGTTKYCGGSSFLPQPDCECIEDSPFTGTWNGTWSSSSSSESGTLRLTFDIRGYGDGELRLINSGQSFGVGAAIFENDTVMELNSERTRTGPTDSQGIRYTGPVTINTQAGTINATLTIHPYTISQGEITLGPSSGTIQIQLTRT